MGIEFRDARTIKYVRCGKRTVKAGEAVAVWDMYGRHTQIIGPALVRLFCSTVRFLTRFVAGPNEYLVIKHRDGRIEHVPGPKAVFQNPVLHIGVSVKKAVVLANAKECLVVYSQKAQSSPSMGVAALSASATGNDGIIANSTKNPIDTAMVESKTGDADADDDKTAAATAASDKSLRRRATGRNNQVARRVLAGPAVFMPEVGEWLHKFSWTSTAKAAAAGARGSGGGAKESFSVLQLGARRWDTSVPLRTSDAVQITANVSLQFAVRDLSAVLDACADPIAALQSLLLADLGELGGLIRSDDLLNSDARRKITAQLGDRATYKKLTAGARQMGIDIQSLCLHGLDPNAALQRQFDHAIQTKARLKADRAVAEQEQRIVDQKLMNQKRRMENEQAIMSSQLDHKLKMRRQEQDLAFAQEKRSSDQVLSFLASLKKNGVDLTQFLTSFAGQKATIGHISKNSTMAHLQPPAPPLQAGGAAGWVAVGGAGK